MKTPKINSSKRFWMTIMAVILFSGIGIYAINKDLELTANIAISGSVLIAGSYLGVESFKPSKK